MAWTQTDIDTLRAALASGVLNVRHSDGRSVTYQSTEQMMAALAKIEKEFAGSTSGRSTFASFNRG